MRAGVRRIRRIKYGPLREGTVNVSASQAVWATIVGAVGSALLIAFLLRVLPWAIKKAFQDIVEQALAKALLEMQTTVLGPLLVRVHDLEKIVYSNGVQAPHEGQPHS